MVHVRFKLSVPSLVVVCSLIRGCLSCCPFHFGGLSLSFLCRLSVFFFSPEFGRSVRMFWDVHWILATGWFGWEYTQSVDNERCDRTSFPSYLAVCPSLSFICLGRLFVSRICFGCVFDCFVRLLRVCICIYQWSACQVSLSADSRFGRRARDLLCFCFVFFYCLVLVL